MPLDKESDVLLTLAPSLGRRLLGAVSLAVLGLLMAPLIFEATGIWALMFVVLTVAVLVAAWRLWEATGDHLELTRDELRTASGRVLTPIQNVESIDRGVFAFKPSNGFLIKLTEPVGRGWCPGLWWQRGRFIGVGGVVRGGEARAMAEVIMALKDGTLDELF